MSHVIDDSPKKYNQENKSDPLKPNHKKMIRDNQRKLFRHSHESVIPVHPSKILD